MEPTEAAAYFALLGFASGNVLMFFLLSWWSNKEVSMACKAHGECQGCRLDSAEDIANELDAKFGTLGIVLNDIEPKMNIKHAQMREYVDEQLRKIDARFMAHSHRMDTLLDKVEKLKK